MAKVLSPDVVSKVFSVWNEANDEVKGTLDYAKYHACMSYKVIGTNKWIFSGWYVPNYDPNIITVTIKKVRGVTYLIVDCTVHIGYPNFATIERYELNQNVLDLIGSLIGEI
jgi:hypothetical protein